MEEGDHLPHPVARSHRWSQPARAGTRIDQDSAMPWIRPIRGRQVRKKSLGLKRDAGKATVVFHGIVGLV
ncbi:hypothetical protein HRbin30_02270 [bacterium HR30]|nr:hypothetical protein HRbin30_02270 [bacterium HR30]